MSRPTPPPTYQPSPTCRYALALFACLSLTACESIGYLGQLLPEDKIPAVYEPMNRPTVIFVDDPASKLETGQLVGVISSRVAHDLEENEIITNPVDAKAIERLRFAEDDFTTWSIARIGREVGAEQVIYIRIDGYELTDAGQIYKPMIYGRVKLVEVSTSQRLFPLDSPSGISLTSEMYYKNIDKDSRNEGNLIGRKLADKFGQDIAKIFYAHHGRMVGSGLDDY